MCIRDRSCTEPVARGEIQLDPSNYWTLTNFLSFLAIKEETALVIDVGVQDEFELCAHFGRLHPSRLNWFPVHAWNTETPTCAYSNAFRPQFLDLYGCSAIINIARYLQSEGHDRPQTCRWASSRVGLIKDTSNSIKIPYGGFSKIRSHIISYNY